LPEAIAGRIRHPAAPADAARVGSAAIFMVGWDTAKLTDDDKRDTLQVRGRRDGNKEDFKRVEKFA